LKRSVYILMLVAMAVLSACGGNGSTGSTVPATAPVTATGRLSDAWVQGLVYESGSQSGVTDADGRFTYEPGKTVKFTIGDIVFGEATAQPIMTPLEFAPAGSTAETPEVVARVQLLLSISSTDPATGRLVISPEAREAAQGKSVNFATISQAELAVLIGQLVPGASLVGPAAAIEHFLGNYDKLFTVAKVSGKTFYMSGNDGYHSVTFAADGSVTASDRVTEGTPLESPYGTWEITTDGKLQIAMIGGETKTITIASGNNLLSYWIFDNSGGVAWEAGDRCFYDQANGLAQARIYSKFVGKTVYSVGTDGYHSWTLRVDNKMYANTRITSGPLPEETLIGTWDVATTGKMQLVTLGGETKTLTIAYENVAEQYWMFENSGGVMWESTDRCYYNQVTGLAQAIDYFMYLMTPL